MNETFEQMVRNLHTKMPMATQEDAIAFATRIKEELCKGQEPVAWINDKLPHMTVRIKPHEGGNWVPVFHHPAPIPADMVMVPPWVLKPAQSLAKYMAKEFYPEVTGFEVLGDLAGVISQIDNMVCGLPTEAAMITAYEKEQGK